MSTLRNIQSTETQQSAWEGAVIQAQAVGSDDRSESC